MFQKLATIVATIAISKLEQMYKHTNEHTNVQTHKHTNTQTHKHTNTQTHKHTKTQTHKRATTKTHKRANQQLNLKGGFQRSHKRVPMELESTNPKMI